MSTAKQHHLLSIVLLNLRTNVFHYLKVIMPTEHDAKDARNKPKLFKNVDTKNSLY